MERAGSDRPRHVRGAKGWADRDGRLPVQMSQDQKVTAFLRAEGHEQWVSSEDLSVSALHASHHFFTTKRGPSFPSFSTSSFISASSSAITPACRIDRAKVKTGRLQSPPLQIHPHSFLYLSSACPSPHRHLSTLPGTSKAAALQPWPYTIHILRSQPQSLDRSLFYRHMRLSWLTSVSPLEELKAHPTPYQKGSICSLRDSLEARRRMERAPAAVQGAAPDLAPAR